MCFIYLKWLCQQESQWPNQAQQRPHSHLPLPPPQMPGDTEGREDKENSGKESH